MKRKLKITIIVTAVLALLGFYVFYLLTMKNSAIEGTVTEKYTKAINGVDKYFVVVDHSGKREVLESTDSWLNLKWNSADIWANAIQGQRFRLEVVGMRIPFWSMNRNIVSIEKAEAPATTPAVR